MKPIDEVKGLDFCNHIYIHNKQHHIETFYCILNTNAEIWDSPLLQEHCFDSACTTEDYKNCPLNKDN